MKPLAVKLPAPGRKPDRASRTAGLPAGFARPAGGPAAAGGETAREAELKVPSFRANGALFDLVAFAPTDVDWSDAAARLARVIRFNGHPRGLPVAQHCVMGADALMRETGDQVLAGYFLLHDGHEYVIGDQTRPAALDLGHFTEAVLAERGVPSARLRGAVAEAIRRSKAAKDAAIHAAANLPPIDRMPIYRRQVAAMDERMLRAEGLVMFGQAAAAHLPAADLPPPKLAGPLSPWGAAKAELAWLERLDRYLGIVARPLVAEWPGA